MRTHETRPKRADVVAMFDHQDDADEAVLRLHLAGFPDDRIGYFHRTDAGEMLDDDDRNHWLAGATIGTIIGVVLGVGLALALYGPVLPASLGDLWGLMITCAVFTALFAGFVGGWIGSSIPRSRVAVPGPVPAEDPFVLAVAAGEGHDRAAAVIRECGGHEITPQPA